MWVSFHSGSYQGVKVLRPQETSSTLLESLLYHSVTCVVLFQAQSKLDSSILNLASINLAELDLAWLSGIIRWALIG